MACPVPTHFGSPMVNSLRFGHATADESVGTNGPPTRRLRRAPGSLEAIRAAALISPET